MAQMMREAIWLIVAALAGAVLTYTWLPTPDPTYIDVIVPVERIIEREPDTIRTFIDRVRYIAVEPRQIATAPGGAAEQVQEFCKPIVVAAQTETELGAPVDPMLLLRSIRYDSRWAWRKDRLFLSGPLNTGDLKALDYEVRGDWSARTRNSEVLVEYNRWNIVGDVWSGTSQLIAAYVLTKTLFGVLR